MGIETAFFELSAGRSDQLPASTLPEIAFSGRSNAGKSSLINRLLLRKSLARTSSAPGKTATVNFYNLGFCRFVDLPGYGYAKVSKSEKLRWAELAQGYFRQRRDIRLVVQLMDLRHAPTPDDLQMVSFLSDGKVPFLIAATKCDKLNKTERSSQEAVYCEKFGSCPGIPIVPCSAKSGEGVGVIRERILSACSFAEK
ncbi:YihA family ribosome biogenesis GTP-binding protein [Caproiciproducens sp. NJN-50]|uniref:ribosome biogenesis GTP-binding protein YihA/YsxC n=1 Tax=Acutalibacteraceae TaxID=3082771 RepID=UPI000FFE1D1D|nr:MULTISPECIES: ribosome biogenesis GTP-binding protein YihA/YsxC [Acutalibacteraceae]QAT49608.1 YihA family ribosome biogenesis GTP-binding protein [Caproiciproducens sp. NJN-50]